MKVRILPEAEVEGASAAQWYEDRKEGLGDLFLGALTEAILAIQRHPQRYARPVGVRSKREVRRCPLTTFPYAVVYEVKEAELLVVAVAHAQRRPNYWRKRTG
jgi:hypothetical protein